MTVLIEINGTHKALKVASNHRSHTQKHPLEQEGRTTICEGQSESENNSVMSSCVRKGPTHDTLGKEQYEAWGSMK